MKSDRIAALAAVGFLFFIPHLGSAAECDETDVVRVAKFHDPYIQDNILDLTERSGEFAKECIKYESVQIGQDVSFARVTLKGAGIADAALDLFVIKKEPEELKYVVPLLRGSLYSLVTKDSIGSVRELGGKELGTQGCKNLGTDLFLASDAFKESGIESVHCGEAPENPDANTLYLVKMKPALRRPALEAGEIDGMIDFAHSGFVFAQKEGFHTILGPDDFNSGMHVPPVGLIFSNDVPAEWWAEDGVVDRMVRAVRNMRSRLETDKEAMRVVIAGTWPTMPKALLKLSREELPKRLPHDFPPDSEAEVNFIHRTLLANMSADLCGDWTAGKVAEGAEFYLNHVSEDEAKARGEAWKTLEFTETFSEFRCG